MKRKAVSQKIDPISFAPFFFLCAMFAFAITALPATARAQAGEGSEIIEGEEDIDRSWEWAERSFVIVKSTADYREALNAAQNASYEMDLRLDLRDLQPNAEIGLTWPDSECVNNGWEYPCFVPRGRFDNGVYVSIEYSNAYKGFAQGYYIVVVASGAADAEEVLAAMLKKTQAIYPDAYRKKTEVYMGCMH